jgi:dipeptidyl aminopeptidase/acylaminoacyl peptidase
MSDMPMWEARLRAPQIKVWSLMGSAIAWAADAPELGVLLTTSTGRPEVYTFDSSTVPAVLRQVTDRPQGTEGCSISPDGQTVYWFDDDAGNELGRWQAVTTAGPTVTLLAGLNPAYPAGVAPLRDGRVVVGRTIDVSAPDENGFELALAEADGSGRVVFACADPGGLIDVSNDGTLALIGFAPGGDWLHLAVRVVRLADGVTVAELVDAGRNLTAVGFDPRDSTRVLLGHERADFITSALWNTTTDEQSDIVTSLEGDVVAQWYPDGQALLLKVLHQARHVLYRYELPTQELALIPASNGSIEATKTFADGTVHALFSRSDVPASLLRISGARVTDLVDLPGEPPPPTVAASDIHAEGPGGRVHGLVYLPADRPPPFPTVFVPHGGPTANDLDEWNVITAALVDCGYAVVKVNYRGSTGYGAAWRDALRVRLGFIELEDIGAVRSLLESQGVIDPARASIMGGSWGGFLTLMAVGTEPDRWRSGVALVPLADQAVSAEDSPSFMRAYDASLMGGSFEELPEVYAAASPITYADTVRAPLFISAGENDPRCPVRQVDTYVEKLRARGHDVEYERLNTGHGVPDLDTRAHELRQILDFLSRTL